MDELTKINGISERYHVHKYFVIIDVDYWWAAYQETSIGHFSFDRKGNYKSVEFISPGKFKVEIDYNIINNILETKCIELLIRPDNDSRWITEKFNVSQLKRETISTLIIDIK